jgi:hypothetical protein
MALRTPPSWLQNGSHPAENDRLSTQALYATTGIIGTNSLAVTQNTTPGMSVFVTSGWAAILGTYQSNMGVYTAFNDATVTTAIAVSPVANSRIDLICLTVNDSFYTGAVNNVVINVITGTVSVSPAVPATPANSIALAQILVGANVTSIITANITDVRVNTTTNLPVLTKNVITAKGDLIVGTAASASTNLPVGTDGSALVASSLSTTGLAWAGNQAAGKNSVINGGFDFWQRGISGFSTTGTYTADRWYFALNSGTGTVSQDSSNVALGSLYSCKFTSTSSGSPYFIQAIETSNSLQFAGKNANLSVMVATSNSQTVDIFLQYSTSVDASPSSGGWTTCAILPAVATTATLTQKSVSGAVSSNAKSLRVFIQTTGAVTSTGTFNIAQVQLELGSVATTFSRAGGSIGGELALCQRYYQRTTGNANSLYTNIATGTSEGATIADIYIYPPVQMRVIPTSVDYSTLRLNIAAGAAQTVTSVSINTQSTSGLIHLSVNVGIAIGTVGQVLTLQTNNSNSGYLGFSADL